MFEVIVENLQDRHRRREEEARKLPQNRKRIARATEEEDTESVEKANIQNRKSAKFNHKLA